MGQPAKGAVLFDLFGTLVPSFSKTQYAEVNGAMARVLGVDAGEFSKRWIADSPIRGSGGYATTAESISAVSGLPLDDPRMDEAVRIRLDATRRSLQPREETLATLSGLRGRSVKLALVTNCSQDVPLLFPETEMAPFFDCLVYSSEARVRKPDARIYRMALEGLGVDALQAYFVGDGDCEELTGARAVGITPVQLIETRVADPFNLFGEKDRADTRIERLDELLAFF